MSLVLDSNDRAQVADQAGFDIAAGADLLLEVWFRPTATVPAYSIGVGKGNHYILDFNASGYLFGRFRHSVDGNLSINDTAQLTQNVWTHVLAVQQAYSLYLLME